ncbi:SusD/RagB family nutrient-binding outer membrane lipoprotein [Antarcticibacterium sp. 1MA-6-2]|uniref:SusD/RagB family nutrient-binding outer membrane lipoprotein n=1 Tax=Antarcticibacterium sp. 1MA-6-2 TaxID=2908210 RepID=UPI002106DF5D|nr:SusD/RagB family nutrient-binding outer membrane lipoprotein [Antarcticibacterium sp. 1MA-6-2]
MMGQNYTAIIEERDRGINHLGNMLMYNWSQADGFSWYTDEFQYLVTSTFYGAIFNYTYSNPLKQYQAIDNLEGDEFGYYKAIAKIMKAYHFQILVDTYGDVPYTEALQRGGDATPAYDDAQMIYDDLIVQLNTAIDLINSTDGNTEITPVVPGVDDIMFEGDMTAWKQFANNLKARILTRVSDLSDKQSFIQTEMAKTAEEGFYFGNVSINPGYSQDNDRQNPKWDDFGLDVSGSKTLTNDATAATQYVLNYLTTTDDPRIDRLFEEPATGHLGIPQGLTDYDVPVVDAYIPANVSNIGPGILKSASQDAIIYTEAELYLNLAELAFKGLYSGDPQELYESGIQASFDYLGA